MDHKQLLKAIGSRLKKLRTGRGWTQAETAGKAQIGRDFLGRAERGDREPSLFVLHKLAAVFEVEPAYLLTPEDENQRAVLDEIQALLLPRPDQELVWFRELIKFHLSRPRPVAVTASPPAKPRRGERKQ